MPVEHLVFSGGGPNILYSFGALHHLLSSNHIQVSQLKSIHCTSAGALLGFLVQMDISHNYIYDYILKRPWDQLFQITPNSMYLAYSNLGLFQESIFIHMLKPLLACNNLSINITLKELYDLCHVEFFVYTTDLQSFSSVSLSHRSHPDLPVVKAIHMSSAIPPLISPVFYNQSYYFDGGLFSNFPVKHCIDIMNIPENKHNTILAFKNVKHVNNVTPDQDLFSFIFNILTKIIDKLNVTPDYLTNIVHITHSPMYFDLWNTSLTSVDVRLNMMIDGRKCAENFLNHHNFNK